MTIPNDTGALRRQTTRQCVGVIVQFVNGLQRARVLSTKRVLLITWETPAFSATSFMVGRFKEATSIYSGQKLRENI